MPRETSSQPGIAFLVPEFNQTSRDNAYRSLRSRRLEVAGERENGRARGRHARGVSFSRARFFLCPLLASACYAGYAYRESAITSGRDPFNQNFRKFRSKTQWIGSVQPEKFRKNGSTF